MKLKPSKPGLLVRDPKTKKYLPENGADISFIDTYWQRRLNCGDVVEVTEEAPRSEKKNKKEGA